MKVIFGLGNPDDKFKGTRHNIGRRVLFALQDRWNSEPFSEKKQLSAALSNTCSTPEVGKSVLLAVPLTYMNQSGTAVKAVCGYYDIPPEQLIVIHDDSDLPFGEVKVSAESGAGGHKGAQSVIDQLGTNAFTRVRVGIRPEGNEQKAETFVLKPFSTEEREHLSAVIAEAADAVESLLHAE